MQFLSKLKYVGVAIEDLYIRSLLEFCSVVFHTSLTEDQSNTLEAIQTTALKVILGSMYISPSVAREMCGLLSLKERREDRLTKYCTRAVKHRRHKQMFPTNPVTEYDLRETEKYKVNFARTESYKKSAIIKCQTKLNELARDGKI